MKLTFEYREQEFINALKKSFETRGQLVGNIVWFSLMMVFGIYIFTTGLYPIASLFLMGMPIIYLSILVWRTRIIPKNLYEKDPSLKEEQTVTFLEDEVVYQSGDEVSTLPWSRFNGFRESPEYIYIYIFNRTVTIIPNRIFESKEDQIQFLELLESKMKRRKK